MVTRTDNSTESAGRSLSRLLMTAVAALILIAAIGSVMYLSGFSQSASSGPGYTAVALLGPNDTAVAERTVAPGSETTIRVAVSNREYQSMRYRLRVAWENETVETRTLSLTYGERTVERVSARAPIDPGRYRLRVIVSEIQPTDMSGRTTYQLYLWVTVRGEQTVTR